MQSCHVCPISLLANEGESIYGHSNTVEITKITGSFRPRLCENALIIIMCKSQYQGKPNEAFH